MAASMGGADGSGRDSDARIEHVEARARELYNRLPTYQTTIRTTRRPFFVEFAGTPKAGKTAGMEALDRLLRRNDFRVRMISERAGASPLRAKHHVFFNISTVSDTISRILESLDRNDHFVFIDRGLFDSLCWLDWFLTAGRITADEYAAVSGFLRIPRLRRLTDLVFVLTADPETALEREVSGQLTRRPGGIMNPTTLSQLNRSVSNVRRLYANEFLFVDIDTTHADLSGTLERMAHRTLDGLEQFLDFVFVVRRQDVGYLPDAGFVADPQIIDQFLAAIRSSGRFVDRRIAEADHELVQPVPIAYFWHEGRLFLLRRSELDVQNPMHEKWTVWAGGHIRREDEGEDLVQAALERETEEELYLRNVPDPRVVGLVLDNSRPRSRLHVGVVHRVDLDQSVARAMERRRFTEPNGRSLTLELVGPDQIGRYADEMEAWSRAILKSHLRWPC